ncbi:MULTISPECIES: PaaI family thioesterase [Comamonas]|uniref:PaaI family thioesterase n=1 Tax=Comamonas TaxID=283 RepID=UPI0006226628|nr:MULTISPECIES: PaaI family thioesterase [Comamonas]KKI12689.1 thioesterase [Comamonas thiooxydans]TYK77643.1 PaaI family thioesterase [Comamonas sp. Z1]BCX53316.1 thioesterase [Comamonas testosteroni]
MSNSAFVPPEGFEEHVSPSNFVLAQGPMYKRQREDGSIIIGVRVLEQHLNLHGIAHGGFVATVVDNAIGYNVATALAVSIVTAHMNIDYLSSARLRDWIEAEVLITRRGRRMCFADCTLRNGNALMARASCILVPIS